MLKEGFAPLRAVELAFHYEGEDIVPDSAVAEAIDTAGRFVGAIERVLSTPSP